MNYRRLGRSGLKISELSFGSWVTYGNQVDTRAARELMAAAFDAGVNFFDNAEIYAKGDSEVIMGKVLKELGWPRIRYVVSTKYFWGMRTGPNDNNTLNRKYLLDAIDGSLKRLQLDSCRPGLSATAPIRLLRSKKRCGRCTTSSSAARRSTGAPANGARTRSARHGMSPTAAICTSRSMEQPQYNLFHRKRVEREYARLYEDIGLGLTTWSPLASGLLTGKYRNGIPAGTRGTLESYAFLRESLTDPAKNAVVGQLETVAKELGCTLAQLALAWCLRNPRVSSVITGATRVEQVRENMSALDVVDKLTPDVLTRIGAIVEAHAG